MQMINTSECEKCIHSMLNEEDKAKIYIYCIIKNKKYLYGQCLPCEYKELRKIEESC